MREFEKSIFENVGSEKEQFLYEKIPDYSTSALVILDNLETFLNTKAKNKRGKRRKTSQAKLFSIFKRQYASQAKKLLEILETFLETTKLSSAYIEHERFLQVKEILNKENVEKGFKRVYKDFQLSKASKEAKKRYLKKLLEERRDLKDIILRTLKNLN